jgi:tetrahydromethanopterin S-methyltransferase subunit A
MAKYIWAKQVTNIKKIIEAHHNPIKEWHQDPKGYFLIKVNHKKKLVEAGYVTSKHVIFKMVTGTNAMDLYHTVIREKLVSRLEHAAYLGKEFYKAELALRYGKKYVQETPLSFKDPVKVRMKVKS